MRRSGTTHDLILLRADDIAHGACKMLSEVRQLRQVEFVKADERLFSRMGSRVAGIFIKLHARRLTECSQAALQCQ